MKAQFQNSPPFHPLKLQPKVSARLQKVKQVLSEALQSVHTQEEDYSSNTANSWGKRRSEESSQCEEMQEVMNSLKRGYLVVKHSARTRNFHHKFVYVSPEGRSLCWKSLDREDEKRIGLLSITRIVKEGAEFLLKACNVKNIDNCLLVLSQSKKLQLQLGSEAEAENLRYELERAVKFAANMRLNYQY